MMESPDFRPLLAATIPDEAATMNLAYPMLLGSPKFDGIRALILPDRETGRTEVFSRKLKRLPSRDLQGLFAHDYLLGMDGELIHGDPCDPLVYQSTQSAVMSQDGPADDLVFYVFDYLGEFLELAQRPYVDRLEILRSVVHRLPRRLKNHVRVVDQSPLTNFQDLRRLESLMAETGFEGVMVRGSQSPYKFGRSTYSEGHLYKYKRFLDSDAVILRVEEGESNQNLAIRNELGFLKRSSAKAGMVKNSLLGKMYVRDIHSGVEFEIGSGIGMTLELRRQLWRNSKKLPGKIVKYRYQPAGVKDRPRFPRFNGFRDPIDL